MRKLGMVLLTVMILAGCDSGQSTTQKYPKVVKVFMHSPGTYSFMVEDNGQIETVSLLDESTTYKMFTDVPANESMWATVVRKPGCTPNEVEIHVHSANDVGGGEYRVGKSQHIQTIPLESK